MRDEVFNDHAFKQSRMYAKGVICSDCHDPHSGRLKADGAQVCAQCHRPARFAAASHTGHAPAPGAPDCIDCHMPARTYMVVDRRHDHAFRVPRPDRSVALGTPNTCNACHADKPAQWAADAVMRWHGPERKGFQTYGDVFHLARSGNPAARAPLVALAGDPLAPAVARATALGVGELSGIGHRDDDPRGFEGSRSARPHRRPARDGPLARRRAAPVGRASPRRRRSRRCAPRRAASWRTFPGQAYRHAPREITGGLRRIRSHAASQRRPAGGPREPREFPDPARSLRRGGTGVAGRTDARSRRGRTHRQPRRPLSPDPARSGRRVGLASGDLPDTRGRLVAPCPRPDAGAAETL